MASSQLSILRPPPPPSLFWLQRRQPPESRKRKSRDRDSISSPTTKRTSTATTTTTTVLRFEVSDFEDLSNPKGSFVETVSVAKAPHPYRSWHLRVYPRGHQRSRSDKVLVSCFLTARDRERGKERANDSANDADTDNFEFSFRIRDWRMVPKRCGFRTNQAYGFMGHSRERILEKGLTEDGTLVVDAVVKFWTTNDNDNDNDVDRSVWYPKKQRIGGLEGSLLRSPEFADLAFSVGESGTVFRAHRCVLAVKARGLLELALVVDDDDDDNDDNDDSATATNNSSSSSSSVSQPIRLASVEEDIFGAFLDYVYTSDKEGLLSFVMGASDPTKKRKRHRKPDPSGTAIALLVEADKFGAVDLKVFLESVLVDRFLSPSNCCEMLLLADAHWCALLKEAAQRVLFSHFSASRASEGWQDLRASPRLLEELLQSRVSETSEPKTTNNSKANADSSHTLAVEALRDKLEGAGLDVDGSREMLVQRCKLIRSLVSE